MPVVAAVAGPHDRVEGADGPAVLGVDEVHVHEKLVDVGVLGVPSPSWHLLERDAVAAPDLPRKDAHARVVFVFSRGCGSEDGLLQVSAGRYPTREAYALGPDYGAVFSSSRRDDVGPQIEGDLVRLVVGYGDGVIEAAARGWNRRRVRGLDRDRNIGYGCTGAVYSRMGLRGR